ncbi:probable Probable cytosolic iron-sulfur protein assembly protein 1 [Melanopsichium pennsylvanicum]|uniref:Probable cytosolic iron-sulfur protein assembly protein 1 n=2 Tax=Melanopsichium pennsylvanicum TaxID=63383 RepID=A0AAJ5C7J9_9BASI|nr:related to WD40 protein Ciao1 [Melanopsichium pennsylvanicum 4]SNX86970.1 probable Probable cytosolic iron-sulfur protein assembly protein 1 [Melanopsichium pennsylvanicum]
MTTPPTCTTSLHLLADLQGHSSRAWHLAWNPRMPILASCSGDKDVRLYAYSFVSTTASSGPSSSRQPLFNLREVIPTGHQRTVRQVAWSPDGKILATASFDSTVGIWERIQDMDGHDDLNTETHTSGPVALSNRGQYVDEPEWDCVGTLEGHESECKSVAFSHTGGVLASCSRDKSVWIWEVQADAEFECLSVLMEHSQDVKAVAWHPNDEILASASYDDAIKLYLDDPSDDWFCYTTLTGHESTVWSLAFSPCGNYLASASDDLTVRIWRRLDADECEKLGFKPEGKMAGRRGEKWIPVSVLKAQHDRTIYSVSWGVDKTSKRTGNLGRLASGGGDGRICVYEISESGDEKVLAPKVEMVAKMESAHANADVNCVCWAPDSLNGKKTPRFEQVMDDDRDPLESGDGNGNDFSDGLISEMLASAGDDGSVKVWVLPISPYAK